MKEYPAEVSAGLARLVSDLDREDELGCVIRAHIRIEALLVEVIERLAPAKAHLKKLNLDYDGRLQLALVLGLDESFAKPLRTLGTLRNAFAHKPDMALDASAVRNLYQALESDDKRIVQATFGRIKDQAEATREVKRVQDLDPRGMFQIITVSLWAKVQSELLSIVRRK